MYVGGVDKGDHSAMHSRQQSPQRHTRQKQQTRKKILDHTLKEVQIKLKTSTQNTESQYPVPSEPKAAPVFTEGDSSWNYLGLRHCTPTATQNIKSCTHLIKQNI